MRTEIFNNSTWSYNHLNNCVRIDWWDGTHWLMEYDKLNRMSKCQYSNGKWRVHKYDIKNNLIKTIWCDGDIYTMEYDEETNVLLSTTITQKEKI